MLDFVRVYASLAQVHKLQELSHTCQPKGTKTLHSVNRYNCVTSEIHLTFFEKADNILVSELHTGWSLLSPLW